ncbi:MAG: phosphoribosylformylglycinamidine synthase I [Candidatus Omnitrophota bacterium]
MKSIKVLILRTAGTNCDQETKLAFEFLGACVTVTHINDLVRGADKISRYQIITFPGGFTYGDDIAAGVILANELQTKLKTNLHKFLDKNGLMIGICNGFQVLVKMGILPDSKNWKQVLTLSCNDSGKFEDRWVYLKKPNDCDPKKDSKCVWTRGIDQVIYLPVAHGEGKFIARDGQVLDKLKNNGQIVFQYCNKQGGLSRYPENPNGSLADIAGICDQTGRVFGLMPHPERCVFKTQHPHWTRKKQDFIPDGLKIFQNAIDYLKK